MIAIWIIMRYTSIFWEEIEFNLRILQFASASRFISSTTATELNNKMYFSALVKTSKSRWRRSDSQYWGQQYFEKARRIWAFPGWWIRSSEVLDILESQLLKLDRLISKQAFEQQYSPYPELDEVFVIWSASLRNRNAKLTQKHPSIWDAYR